MIHIRDARSLSADWKSTGQKPRGGRLGNAIGIDRAVDQRGSATPVTFINPQALGHIDKCGCKIWKHSDLA